MKKASATVRIPYSNTSAWGNVTAFRGLTLGWVQPIRWHIRAVKMLILSYGRWFRISPPNCAVSCPVQSTDRTQSLRRLKTFALFGICKRLARINYVPSSIVVNPESRRICLPVWTCDRNSNNRKSLKNMAKTTVKKYPFASSEDFFEFWSGEMTFCLFLIHKKTV